MFNTRHKTEQEIMKNWKGGGDKPAVSICCTTYNHELYIAEAIEGFLMQETDFPFEILIRDDCSTDKTALIVKEYANKYPALIKPVYEKENTFSRGVKPMYQLYKIAKGEYIALCEGDDYWVDPLKLQIQVGFLEKNQDYIVTYTALEAFNENGIVKNYEAGVTYDLDSIELKKARPINTLTACFRNVLKEFPPEVGCAKAGDLFLWSLLGHYGKGKFLENIKPSRYRMHGQGIFSQKTRKEQLTIIYITYFALYSYYIRKNNIELSDFFYRESLINSVKSNGEYFYIKVLIRSGIVRILLRLKLLGLIKIGVRFLKNYGDKKL